MKSRESSDLLKDIYDGQVRKDFMSVDSISFLSQKLALNIDCKLTESFAGAIYLTILILPRYIRCKRSTLF